MRKISLKLQLIELKILTNFKLTTYKTVVAFTNVFFQYFSDKVETITPLEEVACIN